MSLGFTHNAYKWGAPSFGASQPALFAGEILFLLCVDRLVLIVVEPWFEKIYNAEKKSRSVNRKTNENDNGESEKLTIRHQPPLEVHNFIVPVLIPDNRAYPEIPPNKAAISLIENSLKEPPISIAIAKACTHNASLNSARVLRV